jgi:hypothetical protein
MQAYCKIHKHRLGNALFMIAYIRALAVRTKCHYVLPKWKYSPYFSMQWKEGEINPDRVVKEPNFDFHELLLDYQVVSNTEFQGYFQSFRYFDDVWDKIKDGFRFKQDFLDSIWERTDFRPDENCWCCHLRLGDYRGNKNYAQIPSTYFTDFFRKYPQRRYFVFSDEIPVARKMLGLWANVEYVEGSTDIEDLALMSQFQNFIICNSSFSWWAPQLATLYHDKVEVWRPDVLFDGDLAKTCTGKDFYKPEWKIKPIHNVGLKESEKIDLKDCTFITVVKIDSGERRENLQFMLEYILNHYDTNIIIGETGTHECEWVENFQNVRYVYFQDEIFHRTKYLNDMFRMSETEIVVNHDVDVLIPPQQMEKAVKLIRDGYDFAYPYDGRFLRIPRIHLNEFKDKEDLSVFDGKWLEKFYTDSVGGCVIARKTSHFMVGGENQNYKKFGHEDVSRWWRYKKLGKCDRIDGPLYHIEHFIGPDSHYRHDFSAINNSELNKEKRLIQQGADAIKKYISTWDWCKI